MNLIDKLRKRQRRHLGTDATVATVQGRLDRMADRVQRAADIVGVPPPEVGDPITDRLRYHRRLIISAPTISDDASHGGHHA